MPVKSDTTSEVGGRSTRFANSYISPGLQATEQHQDLAGFARARLQKLNMLTKVRFRMELFSILLAPESKTSIT